VITASAEARLYFDHITRDYALVMDQPRCREVLAKRARERGHLFILGDASL
jgi:hypothetical protein